MRHLLLTFLFLSCSRLDNGGAEGIDLAPYQNERDRICAEFDATTVERCDRSTFHVLMAAMCPGMKLPTEYEVPSGKWNRDTAPCYPDDSRSETSRDAYLQNLLTENKEAIARIVAYAEPREWETGEPHGGVGNIAPLVPLLRGYTLAGESDSIVDEGIEAAKKAFTGHRGHLVAEYLWVVARLRGGLTLSGSSLLKTLHEETPDSPFLSCLYHRFSRLDSSQKHTVYLLKKMPWVNNTFGWGSSVPDVHYAATVMCLEGK